MATRPAIPAELKRAVLIESGHRCAVHTCRHPDIDVHHITPWAKCKDHAFDNLIALCPNCHRRAHLGEIDLKSLRLYKIRLARSLATGATYPFEAPENPRFSWSDPLARWRSASLVDADSSLDLEVEIEYPEFAEVSRDMRAANYRVVALVNERFRSFKADMACYSADRDSHMQRSLSGSFSVTRLDAAVGSINFAFSSYSGGAHGSHWNESCNFFLAPYSEFNISDVFRDPSTGLDRLSQLCIDDLLARDFDGHCLDREWVLSGASPSPENYRSFNILGNDFRVSFDEYQVGPYAVGGQEVVIPFASLSELLIDSIQSATDGFA